MYRQRETLGHYYRQYGIPDISFRTFKALYTIRAQTASQKAEGDLAGSAVKSGVRQGCVFSGCILS